MNEKQMVAAWERRDPQFDGLFVFGVKTTGIFCRPSCPSQPKLEHLEFFDSASVAVRAGYRPCKRCQPELANGADPAWVAKLKERLADAPKISSEELRALGVAPEQARRWFQKNYGMTFAAWARANRMGRAFEQIKGGETIDDATFDNGYESHSGFRSAFAKIFGAPPGQAAASDCLLVSILDTPLGSMIAAVNENSVCLLEFAARADLQDAYDRMRRQFKTPIIPGENAVIAKLRTELAAYFRGELNRFTVPVAHLGTDFQNEVWHQLEQIPFGQTTSYEEIARRIGSPSACRAVARANASNRIAILIPCHRVIAKDGGLSGYAAGVWRKRQLLDLERKGAMQ